MRADAWVSWVLNIQFLSFLSVQIEGLRPTLNWLNGGGGVGERKIAKKITANKSFHSLLINFCYSNPLAPASLCVLEPVIFKNN